MMLGDGTRQIFSFLLAGDAVASSLFGPRPDCFIETITPVSYRLYDRAAVRDLIFASPAAADTIGRVRMEDQWRTDALIVDLARRPADERIARLILDLRTRLQRRGLVQGYPPAFEFPLRLHHIADALGLTPVHVSKVLSDLRRQNLIALNGRTLTLVDPAGLGCIAHMR
jgi:CRP-like cAMP-binding protein